VKEKLLAAPRVAWPTLVLLVVALGVWIAGIAIGSWSGVLVAALGAYLAFTPLHEAAHRSLARAGWVNAVAGRLAAVPLMGPFVAVRYLHLEHHRHTNDPDADPDHWSGRGPAWLRPLRWLTQDLHYYAMYATRPRPRRERFEAYATLALFAGIIGVLVALGHGEAVLFGWVLPARIAIGVLAWAFDYLPHRPHAVTAREDRMHATRPGDPRGVIGRLAFAATLGQSVHLVHHLYPGVPFYRYRRVWEARIAPGVAPDAL
jgi:fatty acid desaturase